MNLGLQKYASYNVLARKALIYGVPIITLVLFIALILLTGIVGILWLGLIKGIIAPLLLTGILFVIRIMCMDDSRAMESVVWDLKGIMTRLICRSNVTSFTSINDCKTKRREHIHEFYQAHSIK